MVHINQTGIDINHQIFLGSRATRDTTKKTAYISFVCSMGSKSITFDT